MAENKRSFLLYSDVYFTVKKLTDEQAGILFKHILGYVNDENPVTNDVIIDLVFEPIKQQLKRDLKQYEAICLRNKGNGSKGGRPKSGKKKPRKPSGLITNPENPDGSRNNPDNPDEPDNDNDNDNDIVNEKKKFNNIPPSLEQIDFRIKERLITSFTAETFFAHYNSNGWMVGKNKMKDWDSTLTTWNSKKFNNNGNTGKSNQRVGERTNDYWN